MNEYAVVRYSPDQIKEMAGAVVRSGMFPGIKNESQAMTLFMLADANGFHPMKAALMYDILPSGKPSMKGEAMLAEFQARGGTVKWLRNDAEECRAIFTSPGCPEGYEASFTIEEAKTAQLAYKDNYKKYAPDMLRWRCVTRGVKATLPAAGLGLYPTEVARDFDENQPKMVKTDAEILASPGQDAEQKPLSEVLYGHKEEIAQALEKVGQFCGECGAEVKRFPSASKEYPGRLYWQCEGAHFTIQKAVNEDGVPMGKAKASVKAHRGCGAREWAEPWPRQSDAGTTPKPAGVTESPAPAGTETPILDRLQAISDDVAQKVAAEQAQA